MDKITESLEAGLPVEETTVPPLSLRARVVRGAGWLFAGRLLGRGLAIVKLIILARLLAPEDFGLFGIAMLALATMETFTQTGFGQALIQRRDDARRHLDTAWTVQVLRGVILAGALFMVAPLVGWFFDEPRAVPLVRALCAIEIIKATANIGIVYFRKEMEFHKQVIYNLTVSLGTAAVGITLALILRNVWALVWASLSGAAIGAALSYVMHPYRPRLSWNTAQVRELAGFGRWIMASNLLVFFIMNADNAFVGRMLGPAMLGLYVMAYRLSNMAATEISHTLAAVTFPAYSKIQDDALRLSGAHVRILTMTMLLATPLAAGLAVVAPLAVPLILGESWMKVVIPLQLLCLSGWLRAYGATIGPVLVGSGRPQTLTSVTAVQAALMALLLYPFIANWGLPGACWAVILPMFLAQLHGTACLGRVIKRSPRLIPDGLLRPVFLTVMMILILLPLRRVVPMSIPGLITLVGAGAAVYLISAWTLVRCGLWPGLESLKLGRQFAKLMRRGGRS